MKAAIIHAFGGPEVVTIGAATPRAPQADEIVVRVEAVALNPLDLKIVAGSMQQVFPIELPYVPGTDFSGVVESIGAQASHLKAGDRVVGRMQPDAGGALAAQVVINAGSVLMMPEAMSFEQGAALPTAFGTASQALFDIGTLKQGETVLIHAGAGGVGNMAVQLAHAAGARVIATASARNNELVRSLGAEQVIDYRTQDFSQLRDIDLVLDTIGADTLEKSWSVLGQGGRIATTVEFGIAARDGHAGASVFFADAVRFLHEAFQMFAQGRFQIVTDTIFKLDEARSALERLATGHARGKLIVRVGQ